MERSQGGLRWKEGLGKDALVTTPIDGNGRGIGESSAKS